MLDIPAMLVEDDYRNALLPNVSNFEVRNWWETQYEAFSKRFRTEAISPVLNKVNPWLGYPEIRNIIGQQHSSFQIRDLMEDRKILLVNIPQRLGEDISSLVGAMLVSKIQLAAMTRTGSKAAFYVYVDEFQNFVTSAFEKILTEARSFGLGLIVANQYPEQLSNNIFDEKLIQALNHNVAVRLNCYFEDGEYRVLYQTLQDRAADDLIVVPDRPVRGGNKASAQQIRKTCHYRYGRPRREVENAILGRLRRRTRTDDYSYNGEYTEDEPDPDVWVEF